MYNGVKTYVPQTLYDSMTSRPDWPDIEGQMKKMFGDSWELVPIKYIEEDSKK